MQCPICNQPVNSVQHVSACAGDRARDIVEVRPPQRRAKPDAAGASGAEGNFFPLVSAAHEFKTPLVVMLGYADLLRNGHLGSVNDRQRQALSEVHESAERLQKVIQGMLLLYELQAAKIDFPNKWESTEVNEHLKEIFSFWARAAKQKSITYEFQPARGTARVGVEALQLQHIVSNLIENALKFTPAHGKVTLSATPCFWERRRAQTEFLFRFERKENRKIENAVRIDVTDTGPGIPPNHHEDIFADFFKLPGTSSQGTGLGLAIARRLMEAHGGAIWVESDEGRGSRFSLLLAKSR
jgi:signal transduction histidine kinase